MLLLSVVRVEFGTNFCYVSGGTELLNPNRFKESHMGNMSSTVVLFLVKEQASTRHTLSFKGRMEHAARKRRNLFAFLKCHLVL